MPTLAPPRTRYQALARELAQAIQAGRLPAGSALPSLRDCASQRGLSLNTVTAAYRLLEDQGLIAARPQSGFYVRSVLAEPSASLRRQPSQVQGNAQQQLLSEVLQAQGRPGHLNLALAIPKGPRFFPQERLAKTTASLLRSQPELLGQYALPPGPLPLREQVVRRARHLGMALRADDLTITHGAMEALQLALRVTTRPGDTVGIEAPSYFNLYAFLASMGLNAVEIPTHPQQGLDLDAVQSLFEAGRLATLVCMPTVHNPLGCSMPVAHKQRLAALAQQYKVPVIEDLVYAELQYTEPPAPALRAFDPDGWVLVCSGFSKAIAPDFRLGWIDAGRYADAVRHLKFSSTGGESQLLCMAVSEFLRHGHYDHHLRSVRRLYEQQVASVRGLIAEHFPAGTRATQPDGGFLLWLELPNGVDSLALYRAAVAERIVIMPGQVYSQGARYRHCVRISCGQVLDEPYVQGIKTLGALARGLLEGAVG
ncbi:aminotransferase class I/II-fold pyridoxal phosphate-dependent enzyme [Pseudomonas sp. NPDC007930]|uniref:aminotransferase-like domain-containing protein n=1 Tax=Pseudomonas sp. NPDC007930 TaxID=3364417 RepID=UPI0036E5DABF